MLLIISCTGTNFSPEERPRSVAWVKVKTGLTDSTTSAPSGMTKEHYAHRLNNSGYEVSWNRVDDAAYYEIRVSTSIITNKSWDKAALAAKVDNKDTAVIKATITVKPDIRGNNCTGCGLCVPVCPRSAIQIYKGKAVINPDSCVGCGQCYEACPYNAVKDLTLGKYYFFAVRAFGEDKIPAEDVTCTYGSFSLRYKNTEKYKTILGTANWCGKCGKGCYILDPLASSVKLELGGCPVNAIYYDSINLIHIDQSKCIYCGLCVIECGLNNGNWSLRREVVSSAEPIKGEE